jgi:hypothetical protein
MAQAPNYTPSEDFSQDELNNAGGRSTILTEALDDELSAISAAHNALNANVQLNQRDDGEIRDQRVKLHTLDPTVLKLVSAFGGTVRGAWLTATAYAIKDVVTQGGNTYVAAVAHTSGVFATDLAAVRWVLIQLGAATAATGVPFSPTATLAATNVQAAIDEADTENRAISAGILATLATYATSIGSSLIGFIQAGVGAVIRTVQSKLRERVSVFDFMTTVQIAAVQAGAGGSDAITHAAFQAAGDSGAAEIWIPKGFYLFDEPVKKRSTWAQNVRFVGESRTGTIVAPNRVDIKIAPVNVNALFINQHNDGKLSFYRLRFGSDGFIGFTGNAIYCVEGGGADGSAQCILSGSIEECWFSLANTNTGCIRGGLQNYRILNNTIEFAKGFWVMEGAGIIDVLCDNNAMYQSYDGFLECKVDTIERRMITVTNLNVVAHLRGAVINTQNANGWRLKNISAAGHDTIPPTNFGLFDFKNSKDMVVDGFNLESLAPYGLAESAVILSGTSAKIHKGTVRGANYTFTINDATAIDASIMDVDSISPRTSHLKTTGATTGRLAIRGGDWQDSAASGIVNGVVVALEIIIDGTRVVNSGGSAANRNIDLATSTKAHIRNCSIGRDSGAFLAQYFIEAGSTGIYRLDNTDWVGTPPTGRVFGPAPVLQRQLSPEGVRTLGSATDSVLGSDKYLIYSAACTSTLPSAASSVDRGPIFMMNTTAAAVISASSNVCPLGSAAPGTAILAATAGKWAILVSDGTNWRIVAAN